MTANRRSKRAIRSRMEQTGEKYTQARRALLAPGGDSGGTGDDPGATITWPADSLGWFNDQARNAILLADDEARMLSHPRVEPEHLLLAAARYGNVESLLAGEGIAARAIHDVISAVVGFGDRLQLRPRRSPASEQVLRRAVVLAAARGVLGPGTEHLLLALGEQERPASSPDSGFQAPRRLSTRAMGCRLSGLRWIRPCWRGAPPSSPAPASTHPVPGRCRPSSNASPARPAPPSALEPGTRAPPMTAGSSRCTC